MTLSQKIVILRKTKGITQDELARALDVSRQSVHKWESGQCYPEVPKIIKMKELFGISIDDLLDDGFDIPAPEKKKRRTTAQKANSDTATNENASAAAVTYAPVSKDEAPAADDGSVEEIRIDVIEESQPDENTVSDTLSDALADEKAPAEQVGSESDKAQDEKRKGFFGRIFGRKK